MHVCHFVSKDELVVSQVQVPRNLQQRPPHSSFGATGRTSLTILDIFPPCSCPLSTVASTFRTGGEEMPGSASMEHAHPGASDYLSCQVTPALTYRATDNSSLPGHALPPFIMHGLGLCECLCVRACVLCACAS